MQVYVKHLKGVLHENLEWVISRRGGIWGVRGMGISVPEIQLKGLASRKPPKIIRLLVLPDSHYPLRDPLIQLENSKKIKMQTNRISNVDSEMITGARQIKQYSTGGNPERRILMSI